MLRKMMPLRKRPAETAEALMQRIGKNIKRVKEEYAFRDWGEVYFEHVFTWAGHVARLGDYDRDRVTHRVLEYRNYKWIRERARQNKGNQMHGRKVRVWRWEHRVDKLFQRGDWQAAARSKAAWRTHLEKFLSL